MGISVWNLKRHEIVVLVESMREFELQALRSLRTVSLIRIKVISLSGKETVLTVSSKDTVNVVKKKVLGDEFSKELPSYKLVLAKSDRVLKDEKSLEDEGIHENGEFITSCTVCIFFYSGDNCDCMSKSCWDVIRFCLCQMTSCFCAGV